MAKNGWGRAGYGAGHVVPEDLHRRERAVERHHCVASGSGRRSRGLAQQASDRAPIPLPDVHLNPPESGEQVVNLTTWMWIDRSVWQPVSATASAGGVTVTATAAPESVRWAMGNGDVVTCAGPGTPYDPNRPSSEQQSDCSYVYRHSSASAPDGAFTATATITWHVTWTAAGVAGGGDLGTASRTTTFAVRVAEIQAVNR